MKPPDRWALGGLPDDGRKASHSHTPVNPKIRLLLTPPPPPQKKEGNSYRLKKWLFRSARRLPSGIIKVWGGGPSQTIWGGCVWVCARQAAPVQGPVT